jgi:hypothetical protein
MLFFLSSDLVLSQSVMLLSPFAQVFSNLKSDETFLLFYQ